MTKVIVLNSKTLKKIELKKCFQSIGDNFIEIDILPNEFKIIELISVNATDLHEDLMFGYNENRNEGCLFLGYFNDGIV